MPTWNHERRQTICNQPIHRGRKAPKQMTVAELKAWLTSKGAPARGKKSNLCGQVWALTRLPYNVECQSHLG